MANSLKLVFADCFACGMRKEWAEHQLAESEASKLAIEKVPFYAPEAADYIRLAIKAGVNMPFFTDGEKVSKSVADFVVVEEAPKKKKRAKRVKKEEAKVDES